jgi:hypothetical protein
MGSVLLPMMFLQTHGIQHLVHAFIISNLGLFCSPHEKTLKALVELCSCVLPVARV